MAFRANFLLHSIKAQRSLAEFSIMMLHSPLAPAADFSTSWSNLSCVPSRHSRFWVSLATAVPLSTQSGVSSLKPYVLAQRSYNSLRVSEGQASKVCRAAGRAEIKQTEAYEEQYEEEGYEEEGYEDDGYEEEDVSSGRRRRGSRFKSLCEISSPYNEIVILDVPETSDSEFAGSRVLLLDNSGECAP
jgi:hypothetical protein